MVFISPPYIRKGLILRPPKGKSSSCRTPFTEIPTIPYFKGLNTPPVEASKETAWSISWGKSKQSEIPWKKEHILHFLHSVHHDNHQYLTTLYGLASNLHKKTTTTSSTNWIYTNICKPFSNSQAVLNFLHNRQVDLTWFKLLYKEKKIKVDM